MKNLYLEFELFKKKWKIRIWRNKKAKDKNKKLEIGIKIRLKLEISNLISEAW